MRIPTKSLTIIAIYFLIWLFIYGSGVLALLSTVNPITYVIDWGIFVGGIVRMVFACVFLFILFKYYSPRGIIFGEEKKV